MTKLEEKINEENDKIYTMQESLARDKVVSNSTLVTLTLVPIINKKELISLENLERLKSKIKTGLGKLNYELISLDISKPSFKYLVYERILEEDIKGIDTLIRGINAEGYIPSFHFHQFGEFYSSPVVRRGFKRKETIELDGPKSYSDIVEELRERGVFLNDDPKEYIPKKTTNPHKRSLITASIILTISKGKCRLGDIVNETKENVPQYYENSERYSRYLASIIRELADRGVISISGQRRRLYDLRRDRINNQ